MTECPYKMKIQKRDSEFWILGVPETDGVGPYTREDATFYMQAIQNMWKYGDRAGYVTTEKRRK